MAPMERLYRYVPSVIGTGVLRYGAISPIVAILVKSKKRNIPDSKKFAFYGNIGILHVINSTGESFCSRR